MRPGFAPFDFSAPIDVEQVLRSIPKDLTVKGMFLAGLLKEAERQGRPLPGGRGYVSFKDYPVAEGTRLSVEVARHLYPSLPVQEGLRRLGRTIYPTLLSSMIGRALFGALGKNIEALVKLVPKGYAISTKDVEVELLSLSRGNAYFRVWSVHSFIPGFHLGILEGVFLACDQKVELGVRVLSPGEMEVECLWG